MSELIPIQLYKIIQSRAYTAIILGNDHKRFAIYVDPSVGKSIQTRVIGKYNPRPSTYELLLNLVKGFDAKILQIVINDLEDTIYFARIYFKQSLNEMDTYLEIDARPSDCLTLALMENIPLYCKKDVFTRATPSPD